MNRAEFIACSLAFHAALLVIAVLLPPPFPSGGYSPDDMTYVELAQNIPPVTPEDGANGTESSDRQGNVSSDIVGRLAVSLPGRLRLGASIRDFDERLAAAGAAPSGSVSKQPPAPAADAKGEPKQPKPDAGKAGEPGEARNTQEEPEPKPSSPATRPQEQAGDVLAAIVTDEAPPRRLATGRSSINFKYQKGWPAPAMVGMDVDAESARWRAVADSGWIIVSPASGRGNGRVRVGVLASSLDAGYHEGVVRLVPDGGMSPGIVPVSVMVLPADPGKPELPHYAWDEYMDGSCKVCHLPAEVMPSADFMQRPVFCALCHSTAGMASGSLPGPGGHPVMVDAGSGGTRMPTYGTVATGPYSDRPASHLLDGRKVVCVTCHNVMQKPGDYGRTWEPASTPDGRTYRLSKGGWSGMGYLVPKVYVTKKLSGMPDRLSGLRSFLVAPSLYECDPDEGTVSFRKPQAEGSYVYVTLSNPYLRAPTANNTLCFDCHAENSHMGLGCLDCHAAHGTRNIMAVREKLRTPAGSVQRVVFSSFTGAGSFADGSATGICEVCHERTGVHASSGGRNPHPDGKDYTGRDCTKCHTHLAGFEPVRAARPSGR